MVRNAWGPVVVGVDASPESARAAIAGWGIAERTKVECRLVHGTSEAWAVPIPPNDASIDPAELNRVAVESAKLLIVQALAPSVPTEALRTLDVRTGRAAVVIRDVADELGAGLIVLGGKHHSALRRWVVGSTAHSIVRTVDVPVLVTTDRPFPPRRIMVAVDLSSAAAPAIHMGERFAAMFDASLEVLHVVEPVPVAAEVPLPFYDEECYARSKEHLERHVWPLVERPGTALEIRRGTASEALASEAAARGTDLLIVGSHGKGWVDRILIGSVTERLLSALPTALLVVPVIGTTAGNRRARTQRAARPRAAEV